MVLDIFCTIYKYYLSRNYPTCKPIEQFVVVQAYGKKYLSLK